jgi:hypothetical protein
VIEEASGVCPYFVLLHCTLHCTHSALFLFLPSHFFFHHFFSALSSHLPPYSTHPLTHVCLSGRFCPGFLFPLRPSPAKFTPLRPGQASITTGKQANRQADATRAKFFPIPIILFTPLQNPRLHASSSPKSSPTQLHYRHPQRSWAQGLLHTHAPQSELHCTAHHRAPLRISTSCPAISTSRRHRSSSAHRHRHRHRPPLRPSASATGPRHLPEERDDRPRQPR